MPKKNTDEVVTGMLSRAIARTRRPAPVGARQHTADASPAERPVEASDADAPRTWRLRPGTAANLREAWLAAKRDDVLLTAQDFASTLVDEALAHRGAKPPRDRD